MPLRKLDEAGRLDLSVKRLQDLEIVACASYLRFRCYQDQMDFLAFQGAGDDC